LTIESYIKAAQVINYPFHLGITEAGTVAAGSVKSSVGLGVLLYNGIGDTIRVSLTGDPVDEVRVAREILKSLKLLKGGIEIISCPTCGRTNVDLVKVAEELDQHTRNLRVKKPVKVAVMGCAVNGPGEAREADIGIAGGKNEFLLFIKGEIVRKIPQQNAISELLKEIERFQNA
ncbi:MAG: flavodoxin-dependent (E)-4-hydroxy-3-methylbut-2-enyl-diphosphate synthase, partial [Caulobacteraceae bacterium]